MTPPASCLGRVNVDLAQFSLQEYLEINPHDIAVGVDHIGRDVPRVIRPFLENVESARLKDRVPCRHLDACDRPPVADPLEGGDEGAGEEKQECCEPFEHLIHLSTKGENMGTGTGWEDPKKYKIKAEVSVTS